MDSILEIHPMGLGGILAPGRGKVILDLQGRTISFGRQTMELGDLRHLELEKGFLTIGTGETWATIDLLRSRDRGGPLVSDGALSPAAVRLIEALKEAIARNRERPQESPLGPPPFHFRFRVRIDRTAIILTALSVLIILADLRASTQEWPVTWPGFLEFLGILILGTAALFIWRRASLLRFDESGVTFRGILGTRSSPWARIREYRRQHGEVEILGDNFRLGLNLEILVAGGTPLVLRRGRLAILSLPARLFLAWLGEKVRIRLEPSLAFGGRGRRLSAIIVGGIVALNSAIFIAEGPYRGNEIEFLERLMEMGARTDSWREEPWRLLTSLFLHGSTFHLIFNMLVLAALGPWMGMIFGWPRTVLLYLGGGVLGNLIGQLLSGAGAPLSVGASTAILALLGSLLGAVYRRPAEIPLAARERFRWAIPMALLLTLGLGLWIQVFDNMAHLGGFAAGLFLVWVVPPRSRKASHPADPGGTGPSPPLGIPDDSKSDSNAEISAGE